MSKLTDKLIKEYSDYLKINKHAENAVQKAKTVKNTLSELSEEAINQAMDIISESIILSNESKLRFENLIELINTYIEVEPTTLPTEIEEFYKFSLPYKVKRIYTVDKEEVIVADKQVFDEAKEILRKRIQEQFK